MKDFVQMKGVWDDCVNYSAIQSTYSSTPPFNAVVKRKIVAEICGVPNCVLTGRSKRKAYIMYMYCGIFWLQLLYSENMKVRRQWKVEDYVEVCRKTSLRKKYRSRRKRVRMWRCVHRCGTFILICFKQSSCGGSWNRNEVLAGIVGRLLVSWIRWPWGF